MLQTSLWQRLVAYKVNQRLPSGLMLCGLPSVDKKTLAKQFAQLILCSQSNKQACGQCRSCILFAAGNHPDFIEVHPEEDSSVIKIDQIRALTETLAQTSALGNYQVATVIKAEDMNRAAANALLKTLEEPHGAVTLILVSEQPSAVPATIRSRCQLLTLSEPTSLNNLDTQLTENLLSVLIQVQQSYIDPVNAASDFAKEPLEVLQLLLTIIHDLILLRFGVHANLQHGDKVNKLLQSNTWSLTQLYQYLDILLEAIQACKAKNNVNVQLLLEKIFIHWRYPHYVS